MLGETHLRSVADAAFESKRRKLSQNTLDAYWEYLLHPGKGWVDWHAERFPGAVNIDQIERPHVQAFVNHLELTYKPRTVRIAFQAIRSVVIKYARVMNLISGDPTLDVDLPRIQRVRIPKPTFAEFLHAMAAIENDTFYGRRDAAIFVLIGLLGLRRSEVLALKLSDYRGDLIALPWRAKNGLTHDLPVSDNAKIVMDRYLEERLKLGSVHGDALIVSGQYTGDAHGGISPERLWAIVKRRFKAAGVQDFSPHRCRAMFGTCLYSATGDIYAAKELLGHTNVQTTIDHYAEPSMEIMRSAVNKIKAA